MFKQDGRSKADPKLISHHVGDKPFVFIIILKQKTSGGLFVIEKCMLSYMTSCQSCKPHLCLPMCVCPSRGEIHWTHQWLNVYETKNPPMRAHKCKCTFIMHEARRVCLVCSARPGSRGCVCESVLRLFLNFLFFFHFSTSLKWNPRKETYIKQTNIGLYVSCSGDKLILLVKTARNLAR